MATGEEEAIAALEVFYRRALKDLNRAIKNTQRRDPRRNKMYEDRASLQDKLRNIAATHVNLKPIEYGVW